MIYIIDLREADSRAEIHKRIREALPVPEYYGSNLDALHDVLTSCPDGTVIIFTNVDTVAAEIKGYVEALRWMCSETAEEYPGIEISLR